MSDRMACRGAATRSVRTSEHMEECRACGTQIQFQLIDHPFWGFSASCAHATEAQRALSRVHQRLIRRASK